MTISSVVTPLWLDRPGAENRIVAAAADEFGYGELWIGEMATYDAFALATAVGAFTDMTITVGPLAVGVRTATGMALGIASVSDLIGRPVRLALGASSPTIGMAAPGMTRRAPSPRASQSLERCWKGEEPTTPAGALAVAGFASASRPPVPTSRLPPSVDAPFGWQQGRPIVSC